MQLVLHDCVCGWGRARPGALTGLLPYCSFISSPHSPPLTATLGSQLLITCAQAASGANPRSQTTEVTLSTLPPVVPNPHASNDSAACLQLITAVTALPLPPPPP